MRRITVLLAALGLALAGLLVSPQSASAQCGNFGCSGNWTWSEYQSLTDTWKQVFVEASVCDCVGYVASRPSSTRKKVEYNNNNGSGYWVTITYDWWSGSGTWHAVYKEWGTPSGYNVTKLPT